MMKNIDKKNLKKTSLLDDDEFPAFRKMVLPYSHALIVFCLIIVIFSSFADERYINVNTLNIDFMLKYKPLLTRYLDLNSVQNHLGDRYLFVFIIFSACWFIFSVYASTILIFSQKFEANYLNFNHHKWLALSIFVLYIMIYITIYADWSPENPRYPGGISYINSKYVLLLLLCFFFIMYSIVAGFTAYVIRLFLLLSRK